jgi:formylglycine-generating enzyme required for sulfatase activity
MLGGRFVRFSDPPRIPDVEPANGPELADVLPELDTIGLRRIFIGFPIYDEAPSLPAQELVQALSLQNVRVIPFFTYVHYVDPASLVAFADDISTRGGAPLAPIDLRIPVLAPEEEIVARVRERVLARRDLWDGDEESPARIDCVEAPPPHSAKLCAVPAGNVWLGSVNRGATSTPPRLYRVDAFAMDEREITVAQYARCVAAGRCHERIPRGVSVALTKNGDAMPQPDLSWSDAADYCTFVGLGLPTEAQWVRAARAEPLDAYPWGQAQPGLPPARANLGEKPGHGLPHYELADPDSSWTGDGVAGLAEGCSFALGRGPFGHCDLIGNLLEWVEGSVPTAKGGSWLDVEAGFVTIDVRATVQQLDLGSYQTGARCARSIPTSDRPSESGE